MQEFNKLIIQTRCKVIIAQDDQASFSINESGEKANWVNISVVDDRLVIYTKPEYYGYLLLHDYYPQITITCKALIGLQMLDKCFVQSAETLILEQMVVLARAGNLNLHVEAFLIDCTVMKTAYAKLSGNALFSRVFAHQRSVYDGSELRASEGTVDVHDEAKASICFEEELELGLFGRSKVDSCGSARMRIIQVDEHCSFTISDNPKTQQQ